MCSERRSCRLVLAIYSESICSSVGRTVMFYSPEFVKLVERKSFLNNYTPGSGGIFMGN
jgi:hypothetical protein